jgi:large subunit ribosomal protein L28
VAAHHDSLACRTIGYSCAVARQAGPSYKTSSFQEFPVAAVCDICAKKPGFGNNRPWSRKITKRRFNPNIQRVRATVNGTPKRLNVCTGCLKAGKVTR